MTYLARTSLFFVVIILRLIVAMLFLFRRVIVFSLGLLLLTLGVLLGMTILGNVCGLPLVLLGLLVIAFSFM